MLAIMAYFQHTVVTKTGNENIARNIIKADGLVANDWLTTLDVSRAKHNVVRTETT